MVPSTELKQVDELCVGSQPKCWRWPLVKYLKIVSYFLSDAEKVLNRSILEERELLKKFSQPSTAGQLQQQEIETGGHVISSQESRGMDA